MNLYRWNAPRSETVVQGLQNFVVGLNLERITRGFRFNEKGEFVHSVIQLDIETTLLETVARGYGGDVHSLSDGAEWIQSKEYILATHRNRVIGFVSGWQLVYKGRKFHRINRPIIEQRTRTGELISDRNGLYATSNGRKGVSLTYDEHNKTLLEAQQSR